MPTSLAAFELVKLTQDLQEMRGIAHQPSRGVTFSCSITGYDDTAIWSFCHLIVQLHSNAW